MALGINDPGQVVGTYVDADGNRHGFLLSKGLYTTLDVPGAAFTVAQGINNAGTIVGLYVDGDGNQHGFVLSKGVYTTIDVPNSTATAVFSINAQGAIVGSYDDADGSPRLSLERLPADKREKMGLTPFASGMSILE